MEKSYSLNLPYPSPEGKITPNTMAMLMEAYGGKGSEFTSIANYTFQHYYLNYNKDDFGRVLQEISIVEMRHLDLLGEAIVYFGGKPLYSGAYSFWNGAWANYTEKKQDIIKSNIIGEQNAIDFYERIIESTENESLKKLIGRIIMDEQLHLTILQAVQNNN